MIKAIVWDIGGVLVENPNVRNFWQNKKGSKKLRHEFGSGKISRKELINKGSKLLGISKKEFYEKYKKAYLSTNIIKETFNIFKNIKIDNYILSDTNSIYTKYLKKKFLNIFKCCKKVFLSNEIQSRKKELKTFRFLIKSLKLKPNEILFIDDKLELLKIAKKLGIKTILYDNPKDLKQKLGLFFR